jgi:DNA polymerase-1
LSDLLNSTPAGLARGCLLIVDGHAFAYRAFHAIPRLNSPNGAPTNAILGFIKILGKMKATLQPAYCVVVWDGGLAAERTKCLPEYKAQRPPMPDELAQQIDEIGAYLQAANIASHCQDGVEADDWIATLTRQACPLVSQIVIASSDKDFMQLVSDRVGLLNPNDKIPQIWTATQVVEKTGVLPEQIIDWLSLLGDHVDNIPGVRGIGPKNASKLLKQFGSCAGLYARLDEVKSELFKAQLRASVDIVRRNQRLIRLQDDLPCQFALDTLSLRAGDPVRLRVLYTRWGFHTLLKELEQSPLRQADLL